MMGGGSTYGMVIWVMSTMCLICVSLGFVPEDNYLINCGSLTNHSVFDRVFMPDDDSNHTFISTPRRVFVNTTSPQSPNPSASEFTLYQTARILDAVSNYSFSIRRHGRHFVRLYFFPFQADVDRNYNMSSAKFSVLAQGFTLLRNFQPEGSPVVKEYSLNVDSDHLVLSFVPSPSSFAFLNALEVVSVPDELIPDSAETFSPPKQRQDLVDRALETVVRVNMGNKNVSSRNDSLWRSWVADGSFLTHGSLNVLYFLSNIGVVNYTGNIAPPSVYGTATKLDTQNDPRTLINMTWSFDVDPGFEYLVRFHFCDVVNRTADQSLANSSFVFNVFINTLYVVKELDLGRQTSNIIGVPYYMDAVTLPSESRKLSISIGSTNTQDDYPNGILNGVEIMKISNTKGSLAVADSDMKSSNSSSKLKVWVIAGSGIGALFILVVVGCISFIMCRRKQRLLDVGKSQAAESEHAGEDSAIISRSKIGYRFPFAAVLEATDKFSENLIIGVGGFGKVYKGVLSDGTRVAVKRGTPKSHQGLAEFRTEIEMLSHFRHRHLVSLIGYCDERNEMIIIYEYMEKGTLKNHLYGSDLPKLNWRQRLEICIGSARGLHYLHTGSCTAIIHRDVKSANILLDENFMAKVADFGLSKSGPEIDHTHVSTAVKGSFGYLDPEYMIMQQLSEKSDVYSFGVVMFEVLCGRPVIDPSLPKDKVNLVEWARKCFKGGQFEEALDPFLVGTMKEVSLTKFVEIAEKCLAERGVDRPAMGDVLWNLECALQLQGPEERARLNREHSNNRFEASVSSIGFSMGSVGDIAGVSMSRVFSDMVKAEMR